MVVTAVLQTESSHPNAAGLDALPDEKALAILAAGQIEAAAAVTAAIPSIAEGARLCAETLRNGGKLIYAAAGSSGLMAMADALELPGTFGIAREQIVILLAGGVSSLSSMLGGPEDDGDAARAAVTEAGVTTGDCLIAVTASGSTPYALAAVAAARAAGAHTIGIANNRGAELLAQVEVAICLETPPEVVAGSTRMGAGTAQKIALNMLSTMMAIHLGHVHDGFMVNVVADNLKLQSRARRIVMAVAGVSADGADAALQQSAGSAKLAILIAFGAENRAAAEHLLTQHDGRLRSALESFRS
jgi:N-acetylmuramic acid 6-phosphate etherase